MSNILSLIEACHEGKPVDAAEAFNDLIAERIAGLIENETPVVVREFFDNINSQSITEGDLKRMYFHHGKHEVRVGDFDSKGNVDSRSSLAHVGPKTTRNSHFKNVARDSEGLKRDLADAHKKQSYAAAHAALKKHTGHDWNLGIHPSGANVNPSWFSHALHGDVRGKKIEDLKEETTLTEDERFHKQSVGKDIGGGFKHIKGERDRSEGHIVSVALTHEQMQKHGLPGHKKAGEYGSTAAIHHPKLGTFHVYQRDYDPVRKSYHLSVRGTKKQGSNETFPDPAHTEHLANHLAHS